MKTDFTTFDPENNFYNIDNKSYVDLYEEKNNPENESYLTQSADADSDYLDNEFSNALERDDEDPDQNNDEELDDEDDFEEEDLDEDDLDDDLIEDYDENDREPETFSDDSLKID